jgi:hypothetical protein
MALTLYRFRSAEALLDKHAELEKQHIYFADPDELNDPMEGFKDLFWQGDEIVWRSLFRNYLYCQMKSLTLVAVAGETFDKSMCAGLVHETEEDLPPAPIRELYAGICEAFFAHEAVLELITMLGTSSAKVRRDELAFYLRALNPLAIMIAKAALFGRGLAAGLADPVAETKGEEIALDHLVSLSRVIRQRAEHSELVGALFEISAIQSMEMSLIQDVNRAPTPTQAAWTFLAREFNDSYIRSLEELVHPRWFAACFLEDPSDASLWGSYGNSHKGICLKFTADTGQAGHPTLSLYRAVGIGGGKDDTRISYDYSPLPFRASAVYGRLSRDRLLRLPRNSADGEAVALLVRRLRRPAQRLCGQHPRQPG